LLNFHEIPTVTHLAFQRYPGISGNILLLILCAIVISSFEKTRRKNFEIFWFVHLLFIVFLVILCTHGIGYIFEPPNFYIWISVPLLIYSVERIYRFVRAKQHTTLSLAIQHPGNILELKMEKKSFSYKPGQYLYLNFPEISKHEWHPFSITSAPEENFISVHISAVGNWTNALVKLVNPQKHIGTVYNSNFLEISQQKSLRMDGPFGAASEEVFNYKVVMLIAAGIGVTPFASILKHINLVKESKNEVKIYFYWICRNRAAFVWFLDLLKNIELENRQLRIYIFLTECFPAEEVKSISDSEVSLELHRTDSITGLCSHTNFGRPRWGEIFDKIAEKHPQKKIGVFMCGPQMLAKNLKNICVKNLHKANFQFHKENF